MLQQQQCPLSGVSLSLSLSLSEPTAVTHGTAEAVEHPTGAVSLAPATEWEDQGRGVVLAGVEQGVVHQPGGGVLGGVALVDAVHDLLVLQDPADPVRDEDQELVLPVLHPQLTHRGLRRHSELLELEVPDGPGHAEPAIDHGPPDAVLDDGAPGLLDPGRLPRQGGAVVRGESSGPAAPAEDGPAVTAVSDVKSVLVLHQSGPVSLVEERRGSALIG